MCCLLPTSLQHRPITRKKGVRTQAAALLTCTEKHTCTDPHPQPHPPPPTCTIGSLCCSAASSGPVGAGSLSSAIATRSVNTTSSMWAPADQPHTSRAAARQAPAAAARLGQGWVRVSQQAAALRPMATLLYRRVALHTDGGGESNVERVWRRAGLMCQTELTAALLQASKVRVSQASQSATSPGAPYLGFGR